MATVECNLSRYVKVGDSIAIGHTEGILAFQISSDLFEASPGASIISCVDQRDSPWFGYTLVHLHPVVPQIKRDVGHVHEVVGKVFFNEVALISAADNEIVDSEMRIYLEDMPQNGASSDLNHRLQGVAPFLRLGVYLNRPRESLLSFPLVGPAGNLSFLEAGHWNLIL